MFAVLIHLILTLFYQLVNRMLIYSTSLYLSVSHSLLYTAGTDQMMSCFIIF